MTMRGDGYIEVDVYDGGISAYAYDGSNREGIALVLRDTPGGITLGDQAWQGLVDAVLRQCDNVAQILGTHVTYNQSWAQARATELGAYRPPVYDRSEEDAEREQHLAIHGPMGRGPCDLVCAAHDPGVCP